MYAIHMADLLVLQREHPIAAMLLADVITPQSATIRVDGKRFDGIALTLDCGDERAAAIVEVLRMKFHKYIVRCYTRADGRWKRV